SPKVKDKLYHPLDYTKFYLINEPIEIESLHHTLLSNEKIKITETWKESQERYFNQIKSIDYSHLRFLNPHIYKVSLTERLFSLKKELSSHFII
ncbi:MAG: hypothetical protein ACXAC7_13140, partial [Candidatus Hodarchaeales archaeon]